LNELNNLTKFVEELVVDLNQHNTIAMQKIFCDYLQSIEMDAY
jgi:hypothetical protein